jgi:histidinol-phosphate phosphatase family protein
MSHIPNQIVILAGGRGTRLGDITKTIPKPMVPFYQKPFLEYLLKYFRDQGGKKFLILLGYLADTVIEYFGNGEQLGIEIEYHTTAVENDTGRRLVLANQAGLIEDEFLMVYCDNYCPLPLEKVAKQWRDSQLQAQFVVYQNTDGYTKSNLRVEDNKVVVYDKSRTTEGLQGVEIGFLCAKKSILDLLPQDENCSLERKVFPLLIESKELGAYLTNHRYYSVGKTERLPLTEQFLKNVPTIFLDRDGVLNHKAPKACYVCTWDDWRWVEGSVEAIAKLTKAGYRLIIISNQAGIARQKMTVDDLDDIHKNMIRDIQEKGGAIEKIYYCPHGWDEGCTCRKPNIGMFLDAQRDFHLDLTKTTFIGDDERDGIAAGKANCKFIMVDEETKLIDVVHTFL